jgi:hypothetical protein
MNRIFNSSVFLIAASLAGACIGAEPTTASEAEPVSSVEQPLTQVNVSHRTWNGGSAGASVWGPTSFAYVDAFENKTAKLREASLYVYAYSYDPASLTCQTETWCWDPADPTTCYSYEWCYYASYSYTYGWGPIPIRDFGVGKKTAELQTDLSKDANFYGYTCTNNGCGAPTGTIDLSWTANGYYSQSFNGTQSQSYTFGNVSYTSRSTGQSSSVSTNVNGVVLGTSFSGASGGIYDSKGTSIWKDIVKD